MCWRYLTGARTVLFRTSTRANADGLVAMPETLVVPLKHMRTELRVFRQGLHVSPLRGSQWAKPYRSFEFLGATSSASVTRCPGEESFTSALIWALKKLVGEKGRFTVSELSRRIRSAPDFPSDQVPVLFERSESSLERIILAPLQGVGKQSDDESEPEVDITKQCLLRLNFIFKTPPSQMEVMRVARALKRAWMDNNMPLDRISWGGLSSWGGANPPANSSAAVIKAVNAFKNLRKRKHMIQEEGSHHKSDPTPIAVSQADISPSSHADVSGQLPTPQSHTPRSLSEATDVSPLREPSQSQKKRRQRKKRRS